MQNDKNDKNKQNYMQFKISLDKGFLTVKEPPPILNFLISSPLISISKSPSPSLFLLIGLGE